MLDTIIKLFNNITGQSFNKPFLSSILGGAASTLVGGLFGGGESAPQATPQHVNPFNATDGLFNTSFQDGNIDIGMSPEMSAAQSGVMGQFGQQVGQTAPQAGMMSQLGTDFLGGIGAYNPQQIAQQQYGLLSPQLLQQQQRGMLDLESRQFAQGRLGSTGGAQQFGDMQLANQLANNNLMSQSFTQGLNAQQQQANLGQQFSQGAPQLQGLYNQLPASLLSQLGGIQGQGLDLLSMGGNLNTVGGTPSQGFSPSQSFGQGMLQSGLEGITGGINGLFQPAPQYQNPLGYGSNYSGAIGNSGISGYAG